ncbi:hypothetical protein E2C01_049543 [Portunus trituberculatus]|uniref:Uncharacterized protein n=1 Tax=Portunus trituberculatus TaxID=210409 RepID=A0A5B7G6P1_PORTR|nr:hypothetical protein [Portunus trituberculatus]
MRIQTQMNNCTQAGQNNLAREKQNHKKPSSVDVQCPQPLLYLLPPGVVPRIAICKFIFTVCTGGYGCGRGSGGRGRR